MLVSLLGRLGNWFLRKLSNLPKIIQLERHRWNINSSLPVTCRNVKDEAMRKLEQKSENKEKRAEGRARARKKNHLTTVLHFFL